MKCFLQSYKFILKHKKRSANVVADSISRKTYPLNKETNNNDDEFHVTDELATIEQTHNDNNMGIGRLYMTEVPDKEDNKTQLGDEPNNKTEQKETEDTQCTNLL